MSDLEPLIVSLSHSGQLAQKPCDGKAGHEEAAAAAGNGQKCRRKRNEK